MKLIKKKLLFLFTAALVPIVATALASCSNKSKLNVNVLMKDIIHTKSDHYYVVYEVNELNTSQGIYKNLTLNTNLFNPLLNKKVDRLENIHPLIINNKIYLRLARKPKINDHFITNFSNDAFPALHLIFDHNLNFIEQDINEDLNLQPSLPNTPKIDHLEINNISFTNIKQNQVDIKIKLKTVSFKDDAIHNFSLKIIKKTNHQIITSDAVFNKQKNEIDATVYNLTSDCEYLLDKLNFNNQKIQLTSIPNHTFKTLDDSDNLLKNLEITKINDNGANLTLNFKELKIKDDSDEALNNIHISLAYNRVYKKGQLELNKKHFFIDKLNKRIIVYVDELERGTHYDIKQIKINDQVLNLNNQTHDFTTKGDYAKVEAIDYETAVDKITKAVTIKVKLSEDLAFYNPNIHNFKFLIRKENDQNPIEFSEVKYDEQERLLTAVINGLDVDKTYEIDNILLNGKPVSFPNDDDYAGGYYGPINKTFKIRPDRSSIEIFKDKSFYNSYYSAFNSWFWYLSVSKKDDNERSKEVKKDYKEHLFISDITKNSAIINIKCEKLLLRKENSLKPKIKLRYHPLNNPNEWAYKEFSFEDKNCFMSIDEDQKTIKIKLLNLDNHINYEFVSFILEDVDGNYHSDNFNVNVYIGDFFDSHPFHLDLSFLKFKTNEFKKAVFSFTNTKSTSTDLNVDLQDNQYADSIEHKIKYTLEDENHNKYKFVKNLSKSETTQLNATKNIILHLFALDKNQTFKLISFEIDDDNYLTNNITVKTLNESSPHLLLNLEFNDIKNTNSTLKLTLNQAVINMPKRVDVILKNKKTNKLLYLFKTDFYFDKKTHQISTKLDNLNINTDYEISELFIDKQQINLKNINNKTFKTLDYGFDQFYLDKIDHEINQQQKNIKFKLHFSDFIFKDKNAHKMSLVLEDENNQQECIDLNAHNQLKIDYEHQTIEFELKYLKPDIKYRINSIQLNDKNLDLTWVDNQRYFNFPGILNPNLKWKVDNIKYEVNGSDPKINITFDQDIFLSNLSQDKECNIELNYVYNNSDGDTLESKIVAKINKNNNKSVEITLTNENCYWLNDLKDICSNLDSNQISTQFLKSIKINGHKIPKVN
ncbi:DUF1410 domain-containing protein [Ureaplasma parvum]|uniref:MBA N-terminal paralog n=2 Tax=Ureaplasma parvum serovar 3 TaxID=38504 RepID=Q9PQ07_UREPA|nr:DUF1410 domain-containing protein [Ureaplasma parvum]pir/H82884/ multiple banded antigen homolog UU483 [imported] - Ureaplasma urealyticum [Ureaplasma urealyticum]AAF30895.1 MBA N-terminal paralog [Ureaplasma parvum serovar 3 str. ATCC 700970]ACA32949.1 putative lipoprotein [Ureaplasma parvum serovar 3 str. ATCC 27815]EDT87923.1 putative lipoprotein [Ureaplasma parvum serovar 14 str. ATCC 33697]EDU19389.1 putative lipoprotein [Ureaplasma parvum serovar 6 str. ATCC 27818]QDI64454.1 DUF1410 